jgi:hypothetical protein
MGGQGRTRGGVAVAPRDRDQAPEGVPLDADWPDLDAASHRFRVDYGALREAGTKLAGQVGTYQRGPGSPRSLAGALSLDGAWGGWESAAPTRAAAQQAMRHVLDAYRRLLEDYEAAGHLLLRTAQNYAEADIGTHAPAGSGGKDPTAGRW